MIFTIFGLSISARICRCNQTEVTLESKETVFLVHFSERVSRHNSAVKFTLMRQPMYSSRPH